MTFDFFSLSRVKEVWSYRSEPENIHALGELLWRTLLVIAFLALLSSVLLGVHEMSAVTQAENSVQAPTSAPPPLDPAKLRSELGTLSARQAQYQSILQSPAPQVADPSK
ncbi:MAG TPA: hypothetical protein VMH91_00660 [Candidatus Paceibacterota bacterium]|nr:hypothetical protein [Candidatus Paceibacterota bacterium]